MQFNGRHILNRAEITFFRYKSFPKSIPGITKPLHMMPQHQHVFPHSKEHAHTPQSPEFQDDMDVILEDNKVPEIFRLHRHEYGNRPEEIGAFRRQVIYRCRHCGTRELELLLGDWLDMNAEGMTYAELEEFDVNVLDIENPQM